MNDFQTSSPTPGPQLFRKVMGLWPTGVAVLAGFGGQGEPLGFALGSLCSVSLEPLLVGFCVQKTSSTWATLRRHGRLSINLLSAAQADLCWRFASGDPARRFDGMDFGLTRGGQPRIPGCCACIDARLEREVDASDHWLALCEVTGLQEGASPLPLAFARGRLNRLEPCRDTAADHFEAWEKSLGEFPFGS